MATLGAPGPPVLVMMRGGPLPLRLDRLVIVRLVVHDGLDEDMMKMRQSTPLAEHKYEDVLIEDEDATDVIVRQRCLQQRCNHRRDKGGYGRAVRHQAPNFLDFPVGDGDAAGRPVPQPVQRSAPAPAGSIDTTGMGPAQLCPDKRASPLALARAGPHAKRKA